MRNSRFWMGKRTWFLADGAPANATGDDSGHPVSPAEMLKRMGPNPNWENGAYHFRCTASLAALLLRGDCGPNTVAYVHATDTDRVGVGPVGHTSSALDVLTTATNLPFAPTAGTLTASDAVNKRVRWTTGAAAGAHGWGTLALAAAKLRMTECLIPVASFDAAPFVPPASTVATPSNGDSFVVESLRAITRLHIDLRSSPSGSSATTRVVLDGIATTMSGARDCGVYSDGSSISTGPGEILNHTLRGCQLVAMLDNGRKTILGGYSTAAQLNLLTNTTSSFSSIDHFTIQGNGHAVVLGANNVGANGEGWAIGQVGMFDMTNLNTTGIYLATVCRFRPSVPAVIYGNGNTVPPFVLHALGQLISDASPATQPYSSTHAAFFGAQSPGSVSGIDTFKCPAYDPASGLWTEPRDMTYANVTQLSVADGGFGNALNHPSALFRGT